jgi:hypothetical protein
VYDAEVVVVSSGDEMLTTAGIVNVYDAEQPCRRASINTATNTNGTWFLREYGGVVVVVVVVVRDCRDCKVINIVEVTIVVVIMDRYVSNDGWRCAPSLYNIAARKIVVV